MRIRVVLFAVVLNLTVFFLTKSKIYSTEFGTEQATFSSQISVDTGNSTPDLTTNELKDTASNSSFRIYPTIFDTNNLNIRTNLSIIPQPTFLHPTFIQRPTFAPRPVYIRPTFVSFRKKKEIPEGLLVIAPQELFFPDLSVSSAEQWAIIDSHKPITIFDKQEGNIEWDLTIMGNNLHDKEDYIPLANLSFFVNSFVVREGGMQGIEYKKNIQFENPGEPYMLVHKGIANEKGIYEINFRLKLLIPPNTSAGSYRTQLVMTII